MDGIWTKAKVIWTGYTSIRHAYQSGWASSASVTNDTTISMAYNNEGLFFTYATNLMHIYYGATFFTLGPKLTKQSLSGILPVIVTWGKRLNLWTMYGFVKLLPGRDPFTVLTFHWPKHVICLFLGQRAGIWNTLQGGAMKAGWFRAQRYHLLHSAFIVMGENPRVEEIIHFRKCFHSTIFSLSIWPSNT